MHEKQSKAGQADWQVVQHIQDFDAGSGSVLERLIFNHRAWIVALCVIVTVLLGWQAMQVRLNADFEKMIPAAHPYIQNYLQNKADLSGLGNSVRVAVETREGTIFDAAYLDRLKRVNDELFLIPGVDRAYQKSLWTANTRWLGNLPSRRAWKNSGARRETSALLRSSCAAISPLLSAWRLKRKTCRNCSRSRRRTGRT